LFDQIVERLSPELRTLALASSVVDPISGELATAISGTPHAAAGLAELARTDVFFDPVPGSAGWYRHRHPSRELLTAELEHHSHDVSLLKSRAARWFAEAGLHEQALETAVSGHDWNVVIEIVWPRWLAAALDDSNPRLEGVPAMPAVVAASSRVAMLVAAALDVEQRQFEQARFRLETLRDERAGSASDDAGTEAELFELLVQLRVARALCDAAALDAASRALRDWCARAPDATTVADVQAVATRASAEARLVDGDLEASSLLLEQMCNDGALDAHDSQLVKATAALALVTALSGRARRAAALVDELGISRCSGLDFARGVRLVTVAICEYHADNITAAQAAAAEARLLLPPGVQRDVVLRMVRARLATSVGDAASGARLARQAEAVGGAALLETVRSALGLLPPSELVPAQPDDHEPVVHPYAAACTAVLEAARAYEAQRPADAWVALEQALVLVERNAYYRVFLDADVEVRPLLRDYITQARPYTQVAWQLLQRLPDDRAIDAPPSVEILTERELAVLRQLPTMKSNREIAAEMYFSVNTVKTHLKSVYRKLGVNRRRAAVEEARARSLL
jgi:LuxR family maltose regulon positive regulatory protein